MAPVDSEPPYRAENPPGKAQRPLDTAAIAGTQQLTTTITESSDETNVGSQGAGLSISADPRRLPDTQALELGDVIGVGGMGEVSVCRDRALLREVAVKTVRADSNDVLAQECALMREAQIMAQLAHPHVLPVHQLGRSEGRAFLSMQLVTASTFEELVKEADSRGRLGTPGYLHEILDIAVRVCDTLSHAHEHGVVHCDIKPANIFVAEFGRVYVIDWGIARLREEWPRTRTFTGTPAFAASEQVETGIVDPRTDVFAVGALLYYALTTHPPFAAKSFFAGLELAREGRYVALAQRTQAKGTPGRLVRAIERCLSVDPEQRFRSAADLKTELSACIRGEQVLPRVRFAADEIIIGEGDVCTTENAFAYLIESGHCEVTKDQRPVRTLGPGEVFGEPAVLCVIDQSRADPEQQPPVVRTATVRALDDVVLQRVDAALFRESLLGMKHGLDKFLFALARCFIETQS